MPQMPRVRTAVGVVACSVGVAVGVLAGSAAAGTVKSPAWAGFQADPQPQPAASPVVTTFQTVGAYWTVPQLRCSGTTGAGDADSYTWVGLGSGSSAERVGVREFCTGTLTAYTTYLEMNNLYEVQAITPVPGDAVTASVSYASGKYRFTLSDSTQHKSFSPKYSCGAFSQGGGTCSRAMVQVGAGIWAPHRSPLADYGAVTFQKITIGDTTGRHGSFAKNRYWRATGFDEYNGTRLAASASPLSQGGTSFTDTWHHS